MQKYNSNWSDWLAFWCFSFNTKVHTETKYTPFELVFGKLCNLPTNLTDSCDPLYKSDNCTLELRLQRAHMDARDNLVLSKIRRKSEHDKVMNSVQYKPDDLVLVKSETGNKLSELYEGPFAVIRECSPNVELIKNGKNIIVHKNRTKLYVV